MEYPRCPTCDSELTWITDSEALNITKEDLKHECPLWDFHFDMTKEEYNNIKRQITE